MKILTSQILAHVINGLRAGGATFGVIIYSLDGFFRELCRQVPYTVLLHGFTTSKYFYSRMYFMADCISQKTVQFNMHLSCFLVLFKTL